jgi:peptide/histidine transporter 3/4
MGAREIKSPEVGLETPTTLGGNSDSVQRKKLGIFFIESDDRRTAFGRGYTGGTTPVNIHGKPIADLSKTGGWIAAFFIFGKQFKISVPLICNPLLRLLVKIWKRK